MDDGRDLDRADLLDLARRLCFILALLERIAAGEPVEPKEVAMAASLHPCILEFLAEVLTAPAICMPPADQPAATL